MRSIPWIMEFRREAWGFFFGRVVQVHEITFMEFTSLGSAVIIPLVILVAPSVSYFYRFIS